VVADFDGSGHVQVMVGEMEIGGYGFGSNPDPNVTIYRLEGPASSSASWQRIRIPGGMHEGTAVDLDLDGRPDIVGGDENSELASPPRDGTLSWFRNLTAAPSATAPANTAAPTVSGLARQGQTLSASTGSWTNSPSGYVYQWRRCDSGGNNCASVGGAAGQSYLLAGADVGSTVRVQVTATNGAGSTAAASAQTPVVAAPTQANLAPNPDVEANPSTTYSANGGGAFSWATDAARSGTHSLKIVTTSSTLSRWLSNTSLIAAQPGRTYTVSAWLKSTGVSQANVSLNFWSGSGTHLGTSTSQQALVGTQPFTQLTVQATAPTGTAYIRLEFRVNGPGTLWTDDVTATTP
jgi:hypothetical protein